MHTCLHTYIHTCIYASDATSLEMDTCMHVCEAIMRAYMHACTGAICSTLEFTRSETVFSYVSAHSKNAAVRVHVYIDKQ